MKTYKEHLEGHRHKKKEASLKTTSSSDVSAATSSSSAATESHAGTVQLHCQLCDITCTGADTYAAHIRGFRHQKVSQFVANATAAVLLSYLNYCLIQ